MFHNLAVYNMLQNFTANGCQKYGPVVGYTTVSFIEYKGDVCLSSIIRYFPLLQ